MAERQEPYAELADVLTALPLAVRVMRRSRRLSLRDAAEKAGIGFTTLARVERGGHCSVDNAVQLLRWLESEGPADA